MLTRKNCVRASIGIVILLSIHCGSESVPQRPDILLITIDTLRADALEPYGATDTVAPNAARLADRRFCRCSIPRSHIRARSGLR